MENYKLYKFENDNLIVYPFNIEKDIYEKTDINIMFDAISNMNARILFFIQDNITFKKLRILKKYFLDNIPYCINVEFEVNYVTVILSRKHGLEAIKEY